MNDYINRGEQFRQGGLEAMITFSPEALAELRASLEQQVVFELHLIYSNGRLVPVAQLVKDKAKQERKEKTNWKQEGF